MQHLRPGELIALENQGAYYIFVILSKSAFFGCQWSFALHQFYPRLPAFEEIQLSQSEGFVALIDFIEERKADSVHRIGKGIDVAPYLEFEHTKAFIRDQNGGGEWFIYARNFQILEKKSKLEVCELEYPIGSGMKARESFELIDKKWTPRILVHPEERGQFPRNSANKSRQRTC